MKRFLKTVSAVFCIVSLTSCSSGVKQEEYDALKTQYETLQEEKENLQEELTKAQGDLTALQKEYDEYKESMKPYEELSIAEAEAAKLKAEEEKRQLEEEEKARKEAEQAEKDRQAEEEAQKQAEEEAKGYETGITYDQLARTPDDYKGKKVKFYGKVIQVLEGDGSVEIRLAVNDDYNMILYCAYKSDIVSSRVLEDDHITVYGTSAGLLTYQSTMGGNITIPSVYVERIDQ